MHGAIPGRKSPAFSRLFRLPQSFPLDGCRGFAGDIVEDHIDLIAELFFDLLCGGLERFDGEVDAGDGGTGGHIVAGDDGADDDRIGTRRGLVGRDGEQHGEALCDLLVHDRAGDDGVRLAENLRGLVADVHRRAGQRVDRLLRVYAVGNAVDEREVVGDGAGDLKERVPVGRQAAAEDDQTLVGAVVTLDADAADRRDLADVFAALVVGEEVGELFALLGRDGNGGVVAEDADAEAGAGERLARGDLLVEAEHTRDLADLILVPVPVGLDDLAFFAELADNIDVVVMRLDLVGVTADIGVAALDQVGAERPLRQEGVVEVDAQLLGRLCGDLDEHGADDLALLLGIDGGGEGADDLARAVIHGAVEELVLGVDALHVDEAELLQVLADEVTLVLAHHAVVDVDGIDVLRRERAHQQRGGDGAVHAARNEDDDLFVSDLFADHAHRGLDAVLQRVGLPEAADLAQKILQHFHAVLREVYLGVELHADDLPLGVVNAGNDIAGDGKGDKAVRVLLDRVAVAHQDGLLPVHTVSERAGRDDVDLGRTVLGLDLGQDDAAEMLVDELHTVADAERRDAELKDGGIVGGRAALPYAGGAAAEDHRIVAAQLGRADAHRENVRVDAQLANLAVNHFCVLAAAVENRKFFHVFRFPFFKESAK